MQSLRIVQFRGKAKIESEECSRLEDFCKSITVLDSIRWISYAWAQVNKSTIQGVFAGLKFWT